ncbi:MAG: hypothetical protein JNL96_11875 [Planctomycetaceae bacterium]|nr:hypothetical protein [Planctomycetaceae bacterium]
MLLLAQFLYRLTFGMALAMAATSPRRVTSGYYRNNCYVLLGMSLLAALAVGFGGPFTVPSVATPSAAESAGGVIVGEEVVVLRMWPAVIAAVLSYFCAACWLYEKPAAGIGGLVLIAAFSLIGTATTVFPASAAPLARGLAYADAVVSGLLLGVTMAAMLLGHWYLNAPGMQIGPLMRLTLLLGAAVLLRTVVSALGLWGQWASGAPLEDAERIMLALRWLAGMAGTAALVVMTYSTLKIPNTQAATGMLYVAVITTFLGELVGQLLSAGRAYPL